MMKLLQTLFSVITVASVLTIFAGCSPVKVFASPPAKVVVKTFAPFASIVNSTGLSFLVVVVKVVVATFETVLTLPSASLSEV
ncbi:MAG: hypothetical protein H0W45_02730 [Acidobacteria bacterium]|nr:hypothetical protein [Acidobacteriota bacterium]